MLQKRILFFPLLCLLAWITSGSVVAQYSLQTLPNPKKNGQDLYVSNPDAVLSPATETSLNQLSTKIEKSCGAEYVVVVINDFEGYDLFEFALSTFNTWGIGKKDRNNGLLLFIAKDRRAYRFVSGYGMESIFPDVYLHRIAEKHLVPNFREGNYDQGVLKASEAVQQALLSSDVRAELERMMPEAIPFFSLRNVHLKNSLWVVLLYVGLYYWVHRVGKQMLVSVKVKKKGCNNCFVLLLLGFFATVFSSLILFWIFAFVVGDPEALFTVASIPYLFMIWGSWVIMFKIYEVRSTIKKSYRDEENKLNALRRFQWRTLLPYLASPLMLIGLFLFQRRWRRMQGRFVPPDASGNWGRVNRDEVKSGMLKKMLSAGQQKEEYLGTKYYEVWLNRQTSEQRVIGWDGAKTHRVCPSCGFKTYLLRASKVLKAATYSNTGIRKVYNQCAFCKHEEDLGTEIIPVKTRSSSSGSSGSGSSSGGSSSSSGGGSFGGGSSGGGGAGGRW